MKWNLRIRKSLLLAGKVGFGSALAIFLAHLFHLINPTAAGTVTLLTLVTSKKETIRLFFSRILTFFVTVSLCLLFYPMIDSDFVAFGIITFFLVLITSFTNTQNTLSVCALINMHFFSSDNHSSSFILNEFWLILIGICIAFVLNLYQDYKGMELDLDENREEGDQRMQKILQGISSYILQPEKPGTIWLECRRLESSLEESLHLAIEYQNSRLKYGTYYRRYFEMRTRQLHILRSLHPHLRSIRSVPAQAEVVSDLIVFITSQINEHHVPVSQLELLSSIHQNMKESELPKTREEFESRAILFHILMDMEQFLLEKKKFIESLSGKERQLYQKERKGTA